MATTQDNDIVVARLDDLVGGDLRRRTQPVARTAVTAYAPILGQAAERLRLARAAGAARAARTLPLAALAAFASVSSSRIGRFDLLDISRPVAFGRTASKTQRSKPASGSRPREKVATREIGFFHVALLFLRLTLFPPSRKEGDSKPAAPLCRCCRFLTFGPKALRPGSPSPKRTR
mgnify:CR=1 FL=1